jgi:hypothetical protein
MPTTLPFRQVHLDFHTSEAIENVADEFDAQAFADTLVAAHVNSINLFARCHHGWLYYDSPRFPELVHPHLARRDLLREQITTCQARGIRTPIYITVQWDYHSATTHPEWLTLGVDGRAIGPVNEPFQAGFWRFLCVNSPYRQFLKAHVQEVLELLPVDGLWLDIVQPVECVCPHCRALMEVRGLDPANAADRSAFAVQSINAFKRDMTAFIRQFNADCLIFYNAGHVGPRHRAILDAYTHLELESLPSGGWGYIHFPLTVRYARNLGLDCLGMNGKFHTSWGDFHSFKNLAALQYEVFLMLAMNAKCCIGDQLHPSGAMSPATYDLIGQVYAEVEAKEPWCEGATPVAEIGVLTPEEFHGGGIGGLPPALMGAVRMLTELGHQFDVLDSHSDFSPYKVLILPDEIPVDERLAAKLKEYLARGGSLLASYHAGLNPGRDNFALPELGVRLVGDAPYSPDFLLPHGELAAGLPATEHVMYLPGLQVEALPGSSVLIETGVPYFNRTYRHFCSHKHTPASGEIGYPGVVQCGRTIYFAHPIFTQYNDNAPRWVKTLLANALNRLLPEPLLRHNGTSTLVSTVNAQPGRKVIHLLHYIPERRGQAFDTIEDVIPLFDVELSLRAEAPVRAVTLVPQGQELPFTQTNGRVTLRVPQVLGHQMIACEMQN